MRFPDDKDKEEKEEKENINGAECERKQGNDEGRHCNNIFFFFLSSHYTSPVQWVVTKRNLSSVVEGFADFHLTDRDVNAPSMAPLFLLFSYT